MKNKRHTFQPQASSQSQSLRLGGRVVSRIAFESCSISRFADCGERELVARRMRTLGAKFVLPLDVAVEVMATPDARSLRHGTRVCG